MCGFDRLLMNDKGYGFKFDACPSCGFAQGQTSTGVLVFNEEVWQHILEAYTLSPASGLSATRERCLALVMAQPQPENTKVKTVFEYDARDVVMFALRLGRIPGNSEFNLLSSHKPRAV